MGDALLRFIVVGDIPGTTLELGYKGSVIFASAVTSLSLIYVIFSQRRRVSKIMKLYAPSTHVDLITL